MSLRLPRCAVAAALLTALSLCPALDLRVASAAEPGASEAAIQLTLRSRRETAPGAGRYHAVTETAKWQGEETAVIVCDMWDLHHCLNATRRGAEMAPRMNDFLKAARGRGAIVIHAPSGCMDFYADHPARKRALETPKSDALPTDIGKWCYQIPAEEQGVYPIDQKEGGEDDDPAEHAEWAKKLAAMGRNPLAPWKRQTETLEIQAGDYISDSGEEIWSILEGRGRENVILVGVHANMCVLGRPFGLRQMSKNGKNVVLIRDLTDTMYNPQKAPFVSHFTGTDLIVEHVEKYVCPTATSDQLLGGAPLRFAEDERPRAVIVMAEQEYKTNETLPAFAVEQLGKHFRIDYVFADERDRNILPGIEQLRGADLLLLSVRRRLLPVEQMKVIREFIESGRPVVAIRTASHAFSVKGEKPSADLADWPEFDRDILGGNYTGHHGNGPQGEISVAEGAAEHPILAGVEARKMAGHGSLYKTSPLAKTATVLLMGEIPDQPAEPIAWTNAPATGGRVFYTSLGHVDDFADPQFKRLLRSAVYWAAEVPVADDVPPGR